MHTTTFLTAGKVHRAMRWPIETRFIRGYLFMFGPRFTVIRDILISMLPQMSLAFTRLPHQKCHNPPALATYDLYHRTKSLHHLNLCAIMSRGREGRPRRDLCHHN